VLLLTSQTSPEDSLLTETVPLSQRGATIESFHLGSTRHAASGSEQQRGHSVRSRTSVHDVDAEGLLTINYC